MCSVYHLGATAEELMEAFKILRQIEFLEPRYNIRPSESVPVIREAADGSREIAKLQWGFVPSWSDARRTAHTLARSETVASSPSFRSSAHNKRCIIPARGFFEWENTSNRTKQKWHITAADDSLMAFAGIWDRYVEDGEELETFAMITTNSNEFMHSMNDRMPVILDPNSIDVWLSRGMTDTDRLRPFFTAVPNGFLTRSAVANIQREDSPKCIAPVKLQRGLFD
ncbi:MAG: SOS response-associated peptidase [Planctomycetota bacterium]